MATAKEEIKKPRVITEKQVEISITLQKIMVSGKYSALSGAVAREQALDNLAANLANVNTTGFKKKRIGFEAILRGAKQTADSNGINYSRVRTIDTDFSQGGLQETGRSLDVAIGGDGFFKTRRGNEVFYTREGHLQIDENGMVKTSEGYNVIGRGDQPLQLIGATGSVIEIDKTGNISLDGLPAGAKLQVFSINDPQKLSPHGHTMFTLEAGATSQPAQDATIIQGSLETSNVNMMEEMATMINTQRKFEAYIKTLESYSTISEKQDELGSVG